MRTIKITDKLRTFVNDKWYKVVEKRKNELSNLKSSWTEPCQQAILGILIADFEHLTKGKKADLEAKFINQIESCKLVLEGNITDKTTFKYALLQALDYKKLRNEVGLIDEFMDIIGLKACPYCNANYTIVTQEKSKSARLELDHYYNKSDFPYLSISFYNLIPCCSNCNRSKSRKDASFYLYDDNEKPIYDFKVTNASVIDYLTTTDSSKKHDKLKLEIEKKEGVELKGEIERLLGIYNTQRDVVEEIIWKKEAYSEAKKKELLESFQQLFPNKETLDRILLGNYPSEEDIHKRPLAKFTQDIAKQLGLI